MTLQERFTAAKAEADGLLQRRNDLNNQMQQVHTRLIGLDSEIALLETLITDEQTNQKLKKRLKAVK
jgi:hypothetical protein